MDDKKYMSNVDGKLVTIPTIDEICNQLKIKFEDIGFRIDYLETENKHLKSEAYKDEELAKMKAAYDQMGDEYDLGFPITREEYDKIKCWTESHRHSQQQTMSTVGGEYSYIFTPTSIGIIGKVKCICGASFTFRELD